MPDAEFLTVEEVAALLRVPRATIYKLARCGELPGLRVGKHWRFRAYSVQTWITEHEGKPREEHGVFPEDTDHSP